MAIFIAYLRVSTRMQGRSGLGIDAQKAAVFEHVGSLPLMTFTEVESGTRSGRKELAKALAACRQHKATLVVAKLDRLARNARFLLEIIDSGVDVVFCDLPQIPPGPLGKFFVTLLAAVAELESGMVSARTKAAMKAAKERGVRFGDQARGQTSNKMIARRRAATLAPVIDGLRQDGITTLKGMAATLNERGIETPHGGKWHPTSVARIIERISP